MNPNRNIQSQTKKYSPRIDEPVNFYAAAAGDLDNDKVKTCYTCRKRGHPHEAITLEKINGRMLADGTNEGVGWRLRNYFDGLEHQHKQPRKGGNIG